MNCLRMCANDNDVGMSYPLIYISLIGLGLFTQFVMFLIARLYGLVKNILILITRCWLDQNLNI